MNTPRNVLVISYLFPPTGNVGVHRTLRFVKWLPESGWNPIVLTASNAKVTNLETSLLANISETVAVYKSHSFEALNSGFSILKNNGEAKPKASFLRKLVSKLPTDAWKSLAVPDEKVGWVPFAIRAGKKILRENEIDAIYVTGKPFSSFLIGESLSQRFGIPWIMDLRDLWTLNRRVRPRNWWHDIMNRRIERRLISNASTVIANTPGNRIDFMDAFPECPADKFVTITNGFDQDDFQNLNRKKYEKFTIAYSGNIYFRKGSARNSAIYDTYSPRHLFKAVAELIHENVEFGQRLQILFTGNGCKKTAALVSEAGLGGYVKLLGWLKYSESLEVISRSHLLPLLLSAGEESEGWIPSKLFQYLGAKTPILGLVPDGDVAEIIRDTRSGDVLEADDIEAIKSVIMQAFSEYLNGNSSYNPYQSEIDKYEARHLTRHLAQALDKAATQKHSETLPKSSYATSTG